MITTHSVILVQNSRVFFLANFQFDTFPSIVYTYNKLVTQQIIMHTFENYKTNLITHLNGSLGNLK